MINLKKICQDNFPVEWKLPYKEFKKQRAKKGISDIDVDYVGDYLDEVIFNSLKRFIEEDPTGPASMTHEEWIGMLKDICSAFGVIVVNNNKLTNLTIDEMYDDTVDTLFAENNAYRTEALDMLVDVWEFLHV